MYIAGYLKAENFTNVVKEHHSHESDRYEKNNTRSDLLEIVHIAESDGREFH